MNAYGETGRGYWQDGVQTLRAEAANRPSNPGNVLVSASGQANAEQLDDLAPTLTIHHEQPYICSAFMAGQARNARSIAYSETVSPTLKASPSGLNQIPCVCEPQIARTLTARGDSSPCADRGQNIVAFAQNQRNEIRDLNGIAGCLAAEPGVKQQTYITYIIEETNCLTPWDTQQARVFVPDGKSPTLAGADGAGGRNPAGLVMIEAHPAVAGTLCASGAGLSRPAGMASETDLCVAYCLQGNMINRKNENGPQGDGINKQVSFTLSAADRHAVAAVDCRNLKEVGDRSGTLQAKNSPGYSLNYQNLCD